MDMLPYLKMMRPLNGAMSVLAVLAGGIVAGAVGLPLGIAMLAAFLIMGAGMVINDWTDIEADKVNKPNRPLPSGQATPKKALGFAFLLFFIGIVLAGTINTLAFIVALINSLILIGYAVSLQNKILLGNIAVSYLVGSTFLFGGAVANSLTALFVTGLLLLLAFFANLSREIVKDMEDIEGDRSSFLKRLKQKTKEIAGGRFDLSSMEPSLKHKSTLMSLAEGSLLLAIVVSPIPLILGMLGPLYLLFLVPTDLLFLLALFLLVRSRQRSSMKEEAKSLLFGKKVYKQVSTYIKLGMLFGLLAFIAGALF